MSLEGVPLSPGHQVTRDVGGIPGRDMGLGRLRHGDTWHRGGLQRPRVRTGGSSQSAYGAEGVSPRPADPGYCPATHVKGFC